MTPLVVGERAVHIADVRARSSADRGDITSALVAAREVRSWVDAQEAGLIAQLSAVDSFPEATIAEASKCSLSEANKARERSDTLGQTPHLAGALDSGTVTAGHIDAVTRASKTLDTDQRADLFDRVESLVGVAAAGSAGDFGRRVRREVDKLRSDNAEERLVRQRRETRLSMWTDNEGMWNLRGRFDPVTGIALSTKIDNTVEALFAEETPELCPTDPVEKQKFLAAHALERLLNGSGGGGRKGRAEFVAIIDADAPPPIRDGPVVDWPIPVELPGRVVAELAADGDVVGIVVRNGVVLHAPGELDLGRTTRLANRAQRRALRGLYRGCAIPGCSVSYDRCKLHHIVWWRHGGRTDLDNLLPVCTKHHGKIHHDNWVIELGPNRELTLRLPDGMVRNNGPPGRRAA